MSRYRVWTHLAAETQWIQRRSLRSEVQKIAQPLTLARLTRRLEQWLIVTPRVEACLQRPRGSARNLGFRLRLRHWRRLRQQKHPVSKNFLVQCCRLPLEVWLQCSGFTSYFAGASPRSDRGQCMYNLPKQASLFRQACL